MSGSDAEPPSGAPQAFVSSVQADVQDTWAYEAPEANASTSPASDRPQTAFGSKPFRNCSHARAAGAAPVYAGDPGYGPHLDRDRDGVGCE
ncbi:excalibur calcium-binding domain-containing protein [Sphingopyxis macrogoltabida]|nr:excalibur calcium-binding domain-containing protein [Sphingopyxis macrogoltabida]